MDWKDLYSKAFPQKTTPKSYSWPKLDKPGPGDPSSYPQLNKPGPGGASAYPALLKPGPGEGSSFPQVPASGAPQGSNYPQIWGQKSYPGSSYPTAAMRDDHWGDFGFRVEIEGVDAGRFTKVEGLSISIEPIEYQHGDDITPRKRPGRIKVENVRLIKGYVNTPALYNWCNDAMKGDVSRKSMSIVLLADDKGGELTRYNLFEVWPCKWSGFKLDGQGRGALVEEIELVVEQIQRG